MCSHPICHGRRRLLLAGLATGLLAACGQTVTGSGPLLPVDIDRSTACALDGMLLADYPGPKAQIHYEGRTDPDFHCDLVEMFALYLNPEQVRQVRAMFVQDMGKADWETPRGHWVEARGAWYVIGSSRRGAMGPTIGSFAGEADAQRFAGRYGGRIHRFEDITPDMVTLDGGALHDQGM